MTAESRWLRGDLYRYVRPINAGENLYFTAGTRICVETWALDWGQHVFEYEVNSRGTQSARPGPIATTRRALRNEFLERRVVTRQPIPVSVGDSDGNWIPEVEMTMGEVAPQIYRSRLAGPTLAWSIHFQRHRYHGGGGSLGAARNAMRRNPNAPVVARDRSRMDAIPNDFNYLKLWVPAEDMAAFRLFRDGFGVIDYIGTEPTTLERWISWITGK